MAEDPTMAPAATAASVVRGKRIVLCADGTWNEPERVDPETGRLQPTNVLKTARAVLPRAADGTTQVVYYHNGVGTSGGLDRITGGAFGDGLEQNVRSLYRFLVYNYEPGDEIYLFGFSRGAFTVRTLAGFIHKAGLLEKEDEYYTPALFRLYQGVIARDIPDWQRVHLHKEPRASPPIRFIGVWDTVGALGAPGVLGQLLNAGKYKYHDVGLNPSIENAVQALAIDEQRKPFAPSIWSRPEGWSGHLEQAWFAGVHSNVGGSYSPDGLANEALHWVVEQAEDLGLEFDQSYLDHYRPCFNSRLNDSMTIFYRIMGPKARQLGSSADDGQRVHRSALDRMNDESLGYAPANLVDFMQRQPDLPVAETTRHPRTPCPPWQPAPR
jgi:uncharacterized protein (DUF2235 family)